jgi:Tfp pilus assembly protein PilO
MQLTLARLTWKQQAYVGAGVSAAMIGCFHVFWLGPTRAALAAQQRVLAAARRELAMAAATERSLPELLRRQHVLNERLAALDAAAPTALDAPGAMRDVQATAEDAGLLITRLTPAPAVARDAETEWAVTVEFEAAYQDLVRFLQAVADEPRLLTVTALRLHSPATPADGITVAGSCRVTAFVHRATDAPGHADSAPDASTRTTDTPRAAVEHAGPVEGLP